MYLLLNKGSLDPQLLKYFVEENTLIEIKLHEDKNNVFKCVTKKHLFLWLFFNVQRTLPLTTYFRL